MQGWNKAPSQIKGHDDLSWNVLQVVDYWEYPGYREHGRVPGRPGAEGRRYRLRVRGPLPGNPGEVGEQVVAISVFGDGRGWYMRPDPGPRTEPPPEQEGRA